jgi:Arm DNA-binding domain
MYLEIAPSGGKYWRIKYRFGGRERRLALGVYPDVSLAAARKKRSAACEQLAAGIDPSDVKKADKRAARVNANNSFEAVARDWLEERKSVVQIGQHEKTLARLQNDVFPWLGKRPIIEVDAPEILGEAAINAALKRLGYDTRTEIIAAWQVDSELT